MTCERGFTLIEMAIVLVIITILIGGLAMPLAAQIQARRIAETRQTLQQARDALVGYAMMTSASSGGKPYLPCPDITGDGREDRNGAQCSAISVPDSISYGRLPWATLGVAPQDAWGNRLGYAVVSQFADSSAGFTVTPFPATQITVCPTRSCPSTTADNNVAFALISYGPNGWGAWSTSGTQLALPSGPDEQENLDDNSKLVMRTPTAADTPLGEFDDLVTWASLAELTGRVCLTSSSCAP